MIRVAGGYRTSDRLPKTAYRAEKMAEGMTVSAPWEAWNRNWLPGWAKEIIRPSPANARAMAAAWRGRIFSLRRGIDSTAMNAGVEAMMSAAVPAVTVGSVSPRFRKRWYPVKPTNARRVSRGRSARLGAGRSWRRAAREPTNSRSATAKRRNVRVIHDMYTRACLIATNASPQTRTRKSMEPWTARLVPNRSDSDMPPEPGRAIKR